MHLYWIWVADQFLLTDFLLSSHPTVKDKVMSVTNLSWFTVTVPHCTLVAPWRSTGEAEILAPFAENPGTRKAPSYYLNLELARIELYMLYLLPGIRPFSFLSFWFVQLHLFLTLKHMIKCVGWDLWAMLVIWWILFWPDVTFMFDWALISK